MAARMSTPLSRVALVVALLLAPVCATAQEDEEAVSEQARALFTAGRVAFERNNYEDALRYFREAHALSNRPALLYNIGVAADRLRRDEEALEAFERYLQEVGPDAPQRGDAEARARVLRQQLERGRSSGGSGGSSSGGSSTGSSGDVMGPLGWGILGVGAASLVTGVVFLVLGQLDADAYEGAQEGTPWRDVVDAHERADWMRVTGWVLAGVGVAAAAAGLVVALTAPSSSDRLTLELRPEGLALVWRHR